MKSNQKVAIVTAASRGIGLACVEQLASEGYKLVIMSRSKDIFTVADRFEARPLMGSVEEPENLQRLVQLAYEKYGRIDAVVVNSGHAAKGELLELQDKDWEHGMQLLLMPAVRLARLVAPIFSRQKSGSIVFISSFAAIEPSLDFPVSSVMRAALSSFVKLSAKAMGQHQVTVNAVLPGYVDSYPADKAILDQIPLKRQAETNEIAGLVSFLVSEKARYITGQLIRADGGLVKSI